MSSGSLSRAGILWEQNRATNTGHSEQKKKAVLELITALQHCAQEGDLDKGKHLHLKAFQSGCHTNKHLSTALITMYSSCKSMHLARAVFDSVIFVDVTSWNSLILGYVTNGEYLTALDLFKSLDCEPNSVTFIAALKACGGLGAKEDLDRQFCLVKGMEIHKQAELYGCRDVAVGNALVDMYSRCKSMKHARATFATLVSRTVVSWNTLIMRLAENGEKLVALELFMCMDCEPDSITCVVALKSLSDLAVNRNLERYFCLENGIAIHVRARELGLQLDTFVANTLIYMYSKCHSMVHARAVFDSMATRCVASWTSLMLGYVENGKSLTALELYMSMDCEPNSVTYAVAAKVCGDRVGIDFNACFCLEMGMIVHKDSSKDHLMNIFVGSNLVDLYCKCGSIRHARALFDHISYRDIVTWNNLLLGYVDNGQSFLALELFELMDCAPNSISFFAALKACWELASSSKVHKQFCLMKGVSIHKQIKSCELEDDMFVGSNLVAMYGKCGSMSHAQAVFDSMTHKDVVTWNILTFGYIENDDNLVAIDIFTKMHCEPNFASYIAALKACGNVAALDTGQRIHSRICSIGLEEDPMIATCLVNFYGKCGVMYAAEHVFNKMQRIDVVSCNALMSGYSSLGEVYRLFQVVERMQDAGLQPNEITFLLILKACNHVGLVKEGKENFECMVSHGICPAMEHYACLADLYSRADTYRELIMVCEEKVLERGMKLSHFRCVQLDWHTHVFQAAKLD